MATEQPWQSPHQGHARLRTSACSLDRDLRWRALVLVRSRSPKATPVQLGPDPHHREGMHSQVLAAHHRVRSARCPRHRRRLSEVARHRESTSEQARNLVLARARHHKRSVHRPRSCSLSLPNANLDIQARCSQRGMWRSPADRSRSRSIHRREMEHPSLRRQRHAQELTHRMGR